MVAQFLSLCLKDMRSVDVVARARFRIVLDRPSTLMSDPQEYIDTLVLICEKKQASIADIGWRNTILVLITTVLPSLRTHNFTPASLHNTICRKWSRSYIYLVVSSLPCFICLHILIHQVKIAQ
ncbi:hypothetical protein IAQ61_005521 [Plenodomus lingam]|uniref:uncharacterized protein n=1 Tax=Leptosphaeria maculans TaxID=5022 RepID=UPI003330A8DD|nr:hypothetical protein IAQ61_005521 [Plenodomus lingam]